MFSTNQSKTFEENSRILADQFVKRSNNSYHKLNLNLNNEHLELTNESEMCLIFKNLVNKKAPGPDKLTNKLLKKVYQHDTQYIIDLFNAVLKKGKIPTTWKIGKMIFFKKPNKSTNEPSSYRPITLINGFCKITEHLFISRIEDDLEFRNFFNKNQFGFKKGRSTADAIEQVVNILKKKKSNRKLKLVIAVDISGAFDSINWSVIINNVINAGSPNPVVNACENILVDRCVLVDDLKTKSSRGCPQGGRASPILWKIGMNSLLDKLEEKKVEFVAYADDLILVLEEESTSDLQKKLSYVMNLINDWCATAELKINTNKTEFMLMFNGKLNGKLFVDGNEVELTDRIKYLGIIIDKKLNWKKHIDFVGLKVDNLIDRIRRFCWLRHDVELWRKRKLYHSVFVPTVNYAASVWFKDIESKSSYLNELKKYQRRFILALTGAYRRTPRIELMKLVEIIDVTDEIRIQLESKLITDKSQKLKFKNNKRKEILSEMSSFVLDERINPLQIDNKYTVWFVTRIGPFKTFLNSINLADDDICRLCHLERETPEHLSFHCGSNHTRLSENYTMKELNNKCANLGRKLIAMNRL